MHNPGVKDSYVSINAGYRLSRFGRNGSAYGYPKHDSLNLRYLCACYVDIDYYKLCTDFGTTLGAVVNLQDSSAIPPASIIVRSGRGLWLLWLLGDPKDIERPQWAWPEKVELYCRIQRAIGERLAHMGADLGARDPARHIRVPGSLHSGGEQFVQWWIQGADRRGYMYTLSDLARLFGVQQRKLTQRIRRAFVESNPRKRRGWQALAARRLRDFECLRAMRGGGFDEGCRNYAALVYAWLLRCNGSKRDEAERQVRRMGSECRGPLSAGAVRRAVKTAYGKTIRKVRDQKLSDWLHISPDESCRLN